MAQDDKDQKRGARAQLRGLGPRKTAKRESPAHAALREEVNRLVAETGIPKAWAWQVARKEATLNEVLTRMVRTDRIKQLVARHGMEKGLATQVADGQVTLDHVLFKTRMDTHIAEHRSDAILDRAAADGRTLRFHLHGLRTITGCITALDRYELTIDDVSGSLRVHKLDVKLVAPGDAKVVVQPGKTPAATVPKPQDRYHCSDKHLFTVLDSGAEVAATTLEGDVVVGRVAWIARWEFGLRQTGGHEVIVFRHALQDLREN